VVVEVLHGNQLITPQALAVLVVVVLSLLVSRQARLEPVGKVMLVAMARLAGLAVAVAVALFPQVATPPAPTMVAMAVAPQQVLSLAHQHNMLEVEVVVLLPARLD
jgi:CHASE2 domain-containing sensor protein